MHGTQKRVTPADFAKYKYLIAQAREAEKRRAQLYARILSIVEHRIERGLLINNCVISRLAGACDSEIGYLINEHESLARIICEHQRAHGSTLAQRRKMQGPFVPCNA